LQVVDEFVRLEICVTKYRGGLKDIKRRIGLDSNAYPIMKSREVHSQTKIKVCKTLIRSRSKAWTLSHSVGKMLNIFERNVLKKIYGPAFVNGQ
jgi:hypothetical protein